MNKSKTPPTSNRNHFLDRKMIGTLFEDDELTKKDNIHNQQGRDDKGHMRWHGAFTGGFEAGYKNTCGSKDGWAPQKFISSRNNKGIFQFFQKTTKAQQQTQTIDAFMDEEDVGKYKIGVNLTIREEYDTNAINEKSFLQGKLGFNNVLGKAPQEFIFSENKSIGYKILQQANTQRIIKKTKQDFEIDMPDDPQEVQIDQSYVPVSNENFQGIGYKTENDKFSNTSEVEQYFLSFMRKFDQQTNDFDEQKKIGENKITFNGGDSQKNEEFLFEIEDEGQAMGKNPTKKIKRNMISDSKSTLRDIFVRDTEPFSLQPRNLQIDVPNGYDPFHRVKTLIKQGFDMNRLLIVRKQNKKINLADDDDVRLKEVQTATTIRRDIDRKQFVKSTVDQPKNIEGIIVVFAHDKLKQQRFQQFCWEKEGKIIGGIPPSTNQTEEQKQEEVLEFEHLYQMFQVKSKHVQDETQPPLTEIIQPAKKVVDPLAAFTSTRKCIKWVPANTICQRLGVRYPYSEEEALAIKKRNDHISIPMIGQEQKDKFISKGMYIEGQEEVQIKNDQVFDPTQFGLPQSFKSVQVERSQKQKTYNGEGDEIEAVSIKQRESDEPLGQFEKRVNDQSLFDSIFADD